MRHHGEWRRRSSAPPFTMSANRRFILLLLSAALAAFAGPALPQATAPEQDARPPLTGQPLVTALRGGGYVLYLRHTSTDFGENDERMTDYADCKSQRNLTDAGRTEARTIGAAWRELQIPIGEVLASPFCRTMETGRLVFGNATASLAVRGGPARPDNPDRYAALRQLLRQRRRALARRRGNGRGRTARQRQVPHRRARSQRWLGRADRSAVDASGR